MRGRGGSGPAVPEPRAPPISATLRRCQLRYVLHFLQALLLPCKPGAPISTASLYSDATPSHSSRFGGIGGGDVCVGGTLPPSQQLVSMPVVACTVDCAC